MHKLWVLVWILSYCEIKWWELQDSIMRRYQQETEINLYEQPCCQGLSSYCPLGRVTTDPLWVWSHATLTIENIREQSSVIRQFITLSFVALWPPFNAIFNSSLWAEISNSIYFDACLKVRQVCVKAIYCGHDVVAVLPIGFVESRSYFNCGRWAAQFYSEVIVINCCFSFEWVQSDWCKKKHSVTHCNTLCLQTVLILKAGPCITIKNASEQYIHTEYINLCPWRANT